VLDMSHCGPVLGPGGLRFPSAFRLSKGGVVASHSQIANIALEYLIWIGRTRSRRKCIGSVYGGRVGSLEFSRRSKAPASRAKSAREKWGIRASSQ